MGALHAAAAGGVGSSDGGGGDIIVDQGETLTPTTMERRTIPQRLGTRCASDTGGTNVLLLRLSAPAPVKSSLIS